MNKKTNSKNVSQVNTEKLIAELNSKDLRTHVKARLCLLTMGKDAIPCLVQALEDDNREIRWETAKILAEMRNPVLAPILTVGLENKDPDVRWLSAEGLLALGKEALSPLLSSLIEKPTSTMLLHGAHHVLQDLYLKRRHEGEAQYYSLVSISDEMREYLKPVVKALESDEPSHSLPAAAKAALDYLG